jgi:hypothetical protein
MTTYTVQYALPVDNPVSNVSMSKRNKTITFQVPINHPDAHKMGFMDLMAAAELSGLFTVSTPLNNNRLTPSEKSSKKAQ